MVQSIDGVGTKTIIARKLEKFDTIGIDLLSAAANDILVMGARPLTFLDYIANDKLKPEIVEEIVSGMVKACKETGVSLVGGETAEMPDTYLPGEHDLVGIITGVVEKEKIITGENIKPGDVVLGLPSNGLHTNGYSFARKLFFEIGGYDVNDMIPELDKSVGLTLLEPHINYTNHVFSVLDIGIDLKGIAHITGGGLVENIPRILPNGVGVNLKKESWPSLPVFDVMQSIGDVDENEMFRAFNMGIGMVFIVDSTDVNSVKDALKDLTEVYEIGTIVSGDKSVIIKN
jgi:phosphoribosylformylglycinamidine cyclo-ligase